MEYQKREMRRQKRHKTVAAVEPGQTRGREIESRLINRRGGEGERG